MFLYGSKVKQPKVLEIKQLLNYQQQNVTNKNANKLTTLINYR